MVKTYLELIQLSTFKERLEYLCLHGQIGAETFGYDRYLNQTLYNSSEWKQIRRKVIIRDEGCDLACKGYELQAHQILIHHLTPITVEDIINRTPNVFDLNNLITTTLQTHNAIHYGITNQLYADPIIRTKNDTCPWKL